MSKQVRLRSVVASGFRGCPKPISVSFCTSKGDPVSVLIFGDNGSGKSTLMDAVEFGLQARVGRSQRLQPENGPSLRSFAVDDLPDVCVSLSDDSTCRRRVIEFADDTLKIDSTSVREEFGLAPIGLKRADIVRFLDRPAAERAMVFSDYFSRMRERSVLAEDAELGIRDRKMRRRAVAAELAVLLKVDSVPLDSHAYQEFKKVHLYGGIDQAAARARGYRVSGGIREPDLVRLFGAIDEIAVEIKNIKREVGAFKKTTRPIGLAHISGAFESISSEITASFLEITRASHVAGIEVRYGGLSVVSLELVVQLKNGRTCTPQQVFSEGFQDLLSLLFFFAVLKEAAKHGQQRILLLDDVLQSVDSTIRSGVMRYVLREFRDWQMLITVHDRLWREILRDLFRQAGVPFVETEVRRWEFEHGPVLASPSSLVDGLGSALGRGDPASICAEAGRLMELVADKLSWTIGSSVIRRREDKYTLGDLWPGVRKALKGSILEEASNRVNELLVLRNLVGAHYNEWAGALSDTEANAFGESVQEFVARVFCRPCLQVVESREGRIGCRCGAIQFALK